MKKHKSQHNLSLFESELYLILKTNQICYEWIQHRSIDYIWKLLNLLTEANDDDNVVCARAIEQCENTQSNVE